MADFLKFLGGGLPGSHPGMGGKGDMSDFLWGTPGKTDKLPTMSPQQEQFFQQFLQQLGGGGQLGQGYGKAMSHLTGMLDPESQTYKDFEAPYMKQFQQETIPGIAERFAGASPMGGGALSSSGFGQALSSAGGQLQSNLASMKSGLMQQAMQSLLSQYGGMSGQALGAKPFGYQHQQASPGLVQSILPGLAQAGASAFMGG